MNSRTKWITTTAAVVALTGTLAFAAPHDGKGHRGHHGKRGRGFMSERMAEKLNLTDAQKAQIKSQREAFKAQNQAFFESSRETFKQYRDAKEANDTAKMQSLQPTVDANRAQMKSLRESQRQQFLSILTAEQRAQLDTMKAERKSRREQRQQQ